MREFSNRIALLAIGSAALMAACGGASGNKPGATTSGSKPETATMAVMSGSSALVAQASSWSSVKWGGGGYVSGLIYHPTTPNLLYARTDIGGAYRWNQSTSQWVPITDGLGFSAAEIAFHNVESIGLDPTNDQRVYLVAGASGANGRLYTSTNQGASWTWITLPFVVEGNGIGRAVGERLRLDPTNPSTMFYGSRNAGLWKSTNSGQSWAQVTGLSSYTTSNMLVGVEHLIFDNGNVGGGQTTWNMWAAIAPDYANAAGLTSTFYRSSNGGFSWTPVAVPAAVAGYYIPHYARAADGMYYVVFNQTAGPGGPGPGYLYKFSGLGGTWTLLSSNTQDGYGGVSVHGTGATTRIALAVTNTWGGTADKKIVQLSDNAGSTWREIEAGMAHTPADDAFWGWNDDIEIDPNNRDHILKVSGSGAFETLNASSATPSWTTKVANLEETASLGIATPPAGATYKLINSSGDVGTWVYTDLATKPTKGPATSWSVGNAADMSWSNPQYIASVGTLNQQQIGFGTWSGDGGNTWTNFATLPAGGATPYGEVASIAVTAPYKAIWAPTDSVPSYTTNNGANWTATNLPALTKHDWQRAYRVVADRKNPNKVYAYDSGGTAWSGESGKVYVSTNGGQTFTLSQGSVSANLRRNPWRATSMAVNPNVEGDVWLADGNAVYRSVDSGATWTKLSNFASVWDGSDTGWNLPVVHGASHVALGKAAPGAPYSAAVYVVGTINGQWGVWASDNAGSTWTRFNSDAYQFGGIQRMAADWNTHGRIYVNGAGRGMLYSN